MPSYGTARFRDGLLERDPAAASRIRIEVHDGVSHIDGGRADWLYSNALAWLTDLV